MYTVTEAVSRFLALYIPGATYEAIDGASVAVIMPDGSRHDFGMNILGDIYDGETIIAKAQRANIEEYRTLPEAWTLTQTLL